MTSDIAEIIPEFCHDSTHAYGQLTLNVCIAEEMCLMLHNCKLDRQQHLWFMNMTWHTER